LSFICQLTTSIKRGTSRSLNSLKNSGGKPSSPGDLLEFREEMAFSISFYVRGELISSCSSSVNFGRLMFAKNESIMLRSSGDSVVYNEE